MPDARMHDDGDWLFGVSRAEPYTVYWTSIRILPRVEFSGRYTRIDELQGFATGGGRYKDKAFDLKVMLVEETDWSPAVVFGAQDFHGTAMFKSEYIAASKNFDLGGAGSWDLTIGYGRGRIDGMYGGLRWQTPWSENFRVVLEWDALDYASDLYSRDTGRLARRGGLTTGVEWNWRWVHGQLNFQRGDVGVNLWLRVPLQRATFVPKTDEPAPVHLPQEQRLAQMSEWTSDPEALAPLYAALLDEGVADIRIAVRDEHLTVGYSTRNHSEIGRATGRAARVIALHAPPEIRTLEMTFFEFQIPLVTYRFSDVPLLRAYFDGEATGPVLEPTLSVSYSRPGARDELVARGIDRADVFPELVDGEFVIRRQPWAAGGVITAQRNVRNSGAFRFHPIRVGTYFNDSVAAFRWEFYSLAEYSQWFNESSFVSVAGRLTLWENVSDVIIASTSQIPRVRSDVGEYARATQRVGLQHAYVGHISSPAERIYTMVQAGYFEQMYAGVGGEILYLPEEGNWAVDFRAYGVRQRDFDGGFGFRDYETITALASLYYRVPGLGVTLAARGGRFLARDTGVRFEAKRRFLSNFEAGGWYTVTDANDFCPWCEGRRYRDKGVFLRVSFGAMLPRDSYAATEISLAPWTRDPGQMLRTPGSLYDYFERRLMLNVKDAGTWTGFGR